MPHSRVMNCRRAELLGDDRHVEYEFAAGPGGPSASLVEDAGKFVVGHSYVVTYEEMTVAQPPVKENRVLAVGTT